ncbi:hypothetical protein SASPL_133654 [Salvia splendens]|uniref:Fungal lipase-like domain-containing protein n=1 Tax=Salvia splendens TaxID=180675 RepID=A0A8X8X3F6_SALSN|nr:hypothetical protein SASPL_133654 [Salvia splendens]
MALAHEDDDDEDNYFSKNYLFLKAEVASWFDCLRIIHSKDLEKRDFCNTEIGGEVTGSRYRWIVFISVLLQKALLEHWARAMPQLSRLQSPLALQHFHRALAKFTSMVGNIDRRWDLRRHYYGNKAAPSISIMASELSYENESFARNIVTHHWQSTYATMLRDKNRIVIAFRGTEPFDADVWRTDVDVSWLKILIHENGDVKFILTGHSLGGALAILFVGILAMHEEEYLLRRLEGVYTFGQPKVGNELFGEYIKQKLKLNDISILGCTYHMCPIREWFFDFEELNGGLVYMGNDSPCKTAGIGSIKLRNQDGSTRNLKDVWYVPQLKKNLISLGALESKGLVVMMRDGILKATSGALVMLKGVRKNNLYYYQGYRLWCLESKKTIVSMDVTFDESSMLNKVNPNSSDTSQQVEYTPKQVEFEEAVVIPTTNTTNDSPKEEEESDDEEVPPQEPSQQSEPIAVRRTRRENKKPARFADMVAYALPVVDDVLEDEADDNYFSLLYVVPKVLNTVYELILPCSNFGFLPLNPETG